MRLAFVTTALLAAPLAAQTPSDPAPARVDSIFARVNRSDGPGCALGVYRAGTVVYANGYGMASLEHNVRITPTTDFYIASTSKQFTATSIALLAEAGRLDLDAPIRRWIPELPTYADSVTVNDLVHHTSGIRDYLTLWGQAGRSFGDDISEDEALASITRQKSLDFKPGTRWSYSNSGYFLLSVLVRRVTGKSLRHFTDSAIFTPLGMTHTTASAAKKLNMRPVYIAQLCKAGTIKAKKVGRDWLITPASLAAFKSARRMRGRPKGR